MMNWIDRTYGMVGALIVFAPCRVKFYALFALLILLSAALADDQSYMHAQGHNDYRNWSSQKIQNCCNNQDCRAYRDDEWRETDNGQELLIDGEWCPVLQEHRLIRGKSPNWETAHACVRPKMPGSNVAPCDRFLCFVGVPKT